jgi:hypothetical protein
MAAAVQFNSKVRLMAAKINNIWPYGMLPSELHSVQLTVTQFSPQPVFCICWVGAHGTTVLENFRVAIQCHHLTLLHVTLSLWA